LLQLELATPKQREVDTPPHHALPWAASAKASAMAARGHAVQRERGMRVLTSNLTLLRALAADINIDELP
jgi:hypothetical protein